MTEYKALCHLNDDFVSQFGLRMEVIFSLHFFFGKLVYVWTSMKRSDLITHSTVGQSIRFMLIAQEKAWDT